MTKLFVKISILFVSFLAFNCQAFAAEVLQVSSPSTLLIGDNNRTYKVEIACVKIKPDLEEISLRWLKKELPRHTKINLKPKASLDGILVARVLPFNSNIDIAEKYIREGLAENKC